MGHLIGVNLQFTIESFNLVFQVSLKFEIIKIEFTILCQRIQTVNSLSIIAFY